MTKILITGGNGFIGKHTTKHLIKLGHEVIVASRSANEMLNCKTFQVDLLEREAPKKLITNVKPEVLIHLAWETEHGSFWHSELNVDWLRASNALLEEFFTHCGQRAVLAGSCAEYDWTALGSDGIAHEMLTPRIPSTSYGHAKNSMFNIAQKMIEQGLSIAWGRLFLVYGEAEKKERLVPSIIQNLMSNSNAPMSSGIQIRDLMFNEDAGRAFAELALSQLTGALNVSTGKGVALRSVGELIAGIIGKPELLKLGHYPERHDEPPVLVGDARNLTNGLKFTPAFTLESGISKIIQNWR